MPNLAHEPLDHQSLAIRAPHDLARIEDTAAALALVGPIAEQVLAERDARLADINAAIASRVKAETDAALAQAERAAIAHDPALAGVLIRKNKQTGELEPAPLHCLACQRAGADQYCCPKHRDFFERSADLHKHIDKINRTADREATMADALVHVDAANRLRDAAPDKAALRLAAGHWTAEVARRRAEIDPRKGVAPGLGSPLHAAREWHRLIADAYEGLLLVERDARHAALGGLLPPRYCASCGFPLVVEPAPARWSDPNHPDYDEEHARRGPDDWDGRFCSAKCRLKYHGVETAAGRECLYCNTWLFSAAEPTLRYCSRACMGATFGESIDLDLWPAERWADVRTLPAAYLPGEPAARRRLILAEARRVHAQHPAQPRDAATALPLSAPVAVASANHLALQAPDLAGLLASALHTVYSRRVMGLKGPRTNRARIEVSAIVKEVVKASGHSIEPGTAKIILSTTLGLRVERERGRLYVLDLTPARVADLRERG